MAVTGSAAEPLSRKARIVLKKDEDASARKHAKIK